MRTIWKFPLGGMGMTPSIEMPAGAEVVRFSMQNEQLTVWAIVDPEAPKIVRHFQIVGTGHRIGFEYNKYHGTCDDGPYVWHLFENVL